MNEYMSRQIKNRQINKYKYKYTYVYIYIYIYIYNNMEMAPFSLGVWSLELPLHATPSFS